KSTDGGATFTGTGGSSTSINEGGLQTTLFYHLDLKRDASASVSLGALQDNGDITTTGIPVWTTRVGGDGIDVAYDNGSVAYAIGNTYLGRTMNDGVDNFGAALGGIPASEIKTFFNQINTDPGNTGVVYVSGSSNGLFQSIDSGATFRQIAGLGRPGPVDV